MELERALCFAWSCCQFTPRSLLLSYPVSRGLPCYSLLGSARYVLPKVCGGSPPLPRAESKDAFARTVPSEQRPTEPVPTLPQ